jgi:hypothetical protein
MPYGALRAGCWKFPLSPLGGRYVAVAPLGAARRETHSRTAYPAAKPTISAIAISSIGAATGAGFSFGLKKKAPSVPGLSKVGHMKEV